MKTVDSVKKAAGGAVGLLIVIVIVVAINAILGNMNIRKDLTEEGLYSLSDGTRSILGKLEKKITLKLFLTKDTSIAPPYMKLYAEQVEDLLREYELAGKGNVTVEKYNPKPLSDDEEWAQRYGIAGQPVDMRGTPFYFGIVAVSGDYEGAIPFLDPRSGQKLEYNLTRLIQRVDNPKRPVVGVISSLPVMGASTQFRMPNQPPPPPPWAIIQELQRDFETFTIQPSAEKIPSGVDLLLVIHPKGLSESLLYAIDQYVLKGGKLMAFVDPFCTVDQSPSPNRMLRQNVSSDLQELFSAWGVGYSPGKVAADMRAAATIQRGNTREESPTWMILRKENMQKNDILTSQLDMVMTPFAGHIADNTSADLEFTPLFVTSTNAVTVSAIMSQFGSQAIRGEINKGTPQLLTIGARLNGRFKTAFPHGRPKELDKKGESDPKAEEKEEPGLKEGDSSVIVIADVDMIHNRNCVRQMNFFGSIRNEAMNDNINFFVNAVEQMTGSSDLIAIRSRGSFERPFTVVMDLREKAKRAHAAKDEEINERLNETRTKLQQLQPSEGKVEGTLAAQQKEISKFRKQVREIQNERRELDKELNRDIVSLGRRIKFINIGLMPCLVLLSGLVFYTHRRQKN